MHFPRSNWLTVFKIAPHSALDRYKSGPSPEKSVSYKGNCNLILFAIEIISFLKMSVQDFLVDLMGWVLSMDL